MIEVDVALNVGGFDLRVAFTNAEGITALFGRSGSGKSLTLSLIAGLARPSRGYIVLDGRSLVDTEKKIFVPMHKRRIGLVFQDSLLFPHLSVSQNLLFGRWFVPRAERDEVSFDQVVETLGIGHLLARRPGLLSGGEKQRVAIGRALLSCPKLLLFDEPLAALDMQRKLEILPLIERLRDEFKIPIVYVSHAIEEVARLAALVVMIETGKVKAIGLPTEVFDAFPGETAESRFEQASVLSVKVRGTNEDYGLTELVHPAGTIWLAGRAGGVGGTPRIVVKATDVVLAIDPPHHVSVRSCLAGTIDHVKESGPIATVAVNLDGSGHLYSVATRQAVRELGLVPGSRVYALIKTAALDERKIGPLAPESDLPPPAELPDKE
jgi:molybdate transport system ATP-binding protein